MLSKISPSLSRKRGGEKEGKKKGKKGTEEIVVRITIVSLFGVRFTNSPRGKKEKGKSGRKHRQLFRLAPNTAGKHMSMFANMVGQIIRRKKGGGGGEEKGRKEKKIL